MPRLIAAAAGLMLAAASASVEARTFADLRSGFSVDTPADWKVSIEEQSGVRTIALTSADGRIEMGFVRVPLDPGTEVAGLRRRFEMRLLNDTKIQSERATHLGRLSALGVTYRLPGAPEEAFEIDVRYAVAEKVGFTAWTAVAVTEARALKPLADAVLASFHRIEPPKPDGAAAHGAAPGGNAPATNAPAANASGTARQAAPPALAPAPPPAAKPARLQPPAPADAPAAGIVPLPRLGLVKARPPERCIDERHRALPAAARARLPRGVALPADGIVLHVPQDWEVVPGPDGVTVHAGDAALKLTTFREPADAPRPLDLAVGRLKAEIAAERSADRRAVSAVAPCSEPAFALDGTPLEAARFVVRLESGGTRYLYEAFVFARPGGGPVHAIRLGGPADAFAAAEATLKLMVEGVELTPLQSSPSALNSAASASGSSAEAAAVPTSAGAASGSR